MSRDAEARAFFAPLSAHGDVAAALLDALAEAKLGEFDTLSAPHEYAAICGVTAGTLFCAAAGMATTYWRLSAADRVIALETGATESQVGAEWVEITLFRSDWPAPDLRHWARCAYRFARTGR